MFILSDIQCDVGLIAHMSIDSPTLQVHCGASVCMKYVAMPFLIGCFEIPSSLGDALLDKSIKICGHHCGQLW